jgi:hypothetical protein
LAVIRAGLKLSSQSDRGRLSNQGRPPQRASLIFGKLSALVGLRLCGLQTTLALINRLARAGRSALLTCPKGSSLIPLLAVRKEPRPRRRVLRPTRRSRYPSTPCRPNHCKVPSLPRGGFPFPPAAVGRDRLVFVHYGRFCRFGFGAEPHSCLSVPTFPRATGHRTAYQ